MANRPDEEVICTKCVITSTYPGISFDENGICSECHKYEKRFASTERQREQLPDNIKLLEQLCEDAKRKNKKFDVLVPLSGGKDSMYVMYRAVKELGLNTFAFTLDNGYLTQVARENIDRACRILGVEHVYYCMDPLLMRELFALSIQKTGYFCSICMRAIGMATELVAEMYDIPLVFGGTASNVELPTAPEMFQSGDPGFIKNVLRGEVSSNVVNRLTFQGSLKRRIGYRLFWWGSQRRIRLCAWVNLPDYVEWNYDTMFKTIREELGWRSPSGKEEEHIDCAVHKVSAYIHDRRWKGSEIYKLNYAGLVQAGQLSRTEALKKLRNTPPPVYKDEDLDVFLNDIKMSREDFDRYIDMGPRYVDFRPKIRKEVEIARKIKRVVFSTIGIRKTDL